MKPTTLVIAAGAVLASLMIGAPALGIEGAFPGVSTGGVPAALFLFIAGAAVLPLGA